MSIYSVGVLTGHQTVPIQSIIKTGNPEIKHGQFEVKFKGDCYSKVSLYMYRQEQQIYMALVFISSKEHKRWLVYTKYIKEAEWLSRLLLIATYLIFRSIGLHVTFIEQRAVIHRLHAVNWNYKVLSLSIFYCFHIDLCRAVSRISKMRANWPMTFKNMGQLSKMWANTSGCWVKTLLSF